jgi:hypothetical protein
LICFAEMMLLAFVAVSVGVLLGSILRPSSFFLFCIEPRVLYRTTFFAGCFWGSLFLVAAGDFFLVAGAFFLVAGTFFLVAGGGAFSSTPLFAGLVLLLVLIVVPSLLLTPTGGPRGSLLFEIFPKTGS